MVIFSVPCESRPTDCFQPSHDGVHKSTVMSRVKRRLHEAEVNRGCVEKAAENLVVALQSLLLGTYSFSQLTGYNFLEGKDSP